MLIMPLHAQLQNRERRLNVFALVEKQRKRMQTQAPMVSFSECSGELEGKNIPSRKCERDSFDRGCEDISNAAEPKGSESERIYNPGGAEEEMKVSPWRREHMFEKAVTPSDVGKLNRLVIPKQQAEKYLPLDTAANEKGLLLSFEDSTGKPWRFRYSYWNSSQSYVLTKGWSRFVKDKKLDAGDVVSFDRATHQDANLQRLFINYRRKPFSATALSPGMPFSVKCPLQLLRPFQFPSDAIGGAHVQQQLLSSRALNGGPRRLPLFWPASNGTGESSRGAGETRALHANAQPNDLRNSLRFLTTDKQSRKVIHDSVFPVSIQRLSNCSDCGRPATGTERAPPVHAAIQFESRAISRNDLSQPVENKVSEVAATSFDHCTSKKVVRLFGVDLECGKLYENYEDEDELLIIPPSEHLFPRNSKCDNLDELLPR